MFSPTTGLPRTKIALLGLWCACAALFLPGESRAQTGIITTAVGNGVATFAGDGGPALSVSLQNPRGFVFDKAGSLYIADRGNHRIRKVSVVTGIVTTVAGIGTCCFNGDGGLATGAQLSSPGGVALDAAGNLYIADSFNNRIRKVDAATGIITTVAGNGILSFSGDGDPATSAGLALPHGVALDRLGNVYVADQNNHRIRKVDAATGIITTVAGNGVDTFAGDGGPATSASLRLPNGVAVDRAGNLYIADSDNHRIRRVDAATGTIMTIAGSGVQGFNGDGGPAISARLSLPLGLTLDVAGNILIADNSNHRIRRVDVTTGTITTVAGNGVQGFSGDDGPATTASLRFPSGVAVDNVGRLYLADTGNHRVRRVPGVVTITPPQPGEINTVAGNGVSAYSGDESPATSAGVGNPVDVAVDAAGNFYVADGQSRIRKIDLSTGVITTVAGGPAGFAGDGGPATSARLLFPSGIAVASGGSLFISDTGNNRIRKVDGATGIITTVAGNGVEAFAGDGGPATSASLSFPAGIALDRSDNLYIADLGNHRVRRVDAATGIITTIAGNGIAAFAGDGGPATDASLNNPVRLAFNSTGNLYIADQTNGRIRRVDAVTGIITSVAAGLNVPAGLALDRAGHLLISERGNERIRRVDALSGGISTVAGNGVQGFSGDGGPATGASFSNPGGLALDSAGNLYIADSDNSRIRRVQNPGVPRIVTEAGDGVDGFGGDGGPAVNASLQWPYGIALDSAGNLLIADYGNQRIRKVDAISGVITTVAGNGTLGFSGDGGLATGASLNGPTDVALNAAGDLFIADGDNNRIRRVDALTGVITTVAGDGVGDFGGDGGPATSASFSNPYGIALDAEGNIYIAELNSHRIRRVDAATGIVTTVAGDGSGGFGGDQGQGTSASLQHPDTVQLDAAGNLYIADSANHRVRRIDAVTGIITTVAGNGFPGSGGDDGLATSAEINSPTGLALDSAENIYIADCGGQRVRRVDATTGIITTVAGDGQLGFGGDGGDPQLARLNCPARLTLDGAGSVYIADIGNHRVRRIYGLGPGASSDTTPPAISYMASGPRRDTGWYVGDVSVTWTVFDTESPVVSTVGCGSTTITTDTTGVTLTCTATSSGGTTNESVTIMRDATPPILTVPSSIVVNAESVAGALVHYTATADDALTGSVTPACLPASGSVFPIGETTVECTATDLAGNETIDNFTITVVAAATTPAGSNVAVQPVDTNGNGAPVSMMFDEVLQAGDTTLTVSTVGPPPPSGFQLGDPPVYYNISTTAVFAGQVTVCVDYTGTTFADEAALRLLHFEGGVWTDVTVSLDTDANIICGRTSSFSTFTVVEPGDAAPQYTFIGFLQPVDNLPVINEAKAGKTIPVKWRLKDAAGNFVSDLGSMASLLSAPIACTADPTTIVEEQLSAPGSTVFRYDEASNQFIFNWQSASAWKGCRLLQLTLSDGTYHYAKFNFK